jgi:hypothetical protein
LGYVILNDHFHWMIRLSGRVVGLVATEREQNLSGRSASHSTLTYDPVTIDVPFCRSGCDQRKLPDNGVVDTKYAISEIMQSVKLRFTHRYKRIHGINDNISLWQRRFWDHLARDQEDVNRHLDYIHYNPVKHGYMSKPLNFPFSSFREYVKRGVYMPDWGESGEPLHLAEATWE